jgi:type II secretory pathway pseudopilin PulG
MTLVELLIVVTLLGIVGVFAGAHLGGRDDLAAAAAARRLLASTQFAQNLSIAKRESHYLVDEGDAIAVCRLTATGWERIAHPAGAKLVGAEFGGKLRRGDTQFGGRPVLGFDETGSPFLTDADGSNATPLASVAHFSVKSGDDEVELQVEPVTGTVRLVHLTN